MTRRVVLVTGGTGLIGAQTIAPLRELGFDVVILSRRPSSRRDTHHVICDLFDRGRVEAVLRDIAPTHILHCAWDVTHGQFWHAGSNLDWVGATLALARSAAAIGVARFVGVGTCTEYDWSDMTLAPRRETDPARPNTLYGLAKHATHSLLDSYLPPLGVSFAWARVFNLFGPNEPPTRLLPSLVSTLRTDQTYVCKHGQLVRDYMATADAGAALAGLTASPVTGAVNIASGEAVSLAELTRFVADQIGLGSRLVVETAPAPEQAPFMRADVSRLRHEVGVAPAMPMMDRIVQWIAEAR